MKYYGRWALFGFAIISAVPASAVTNFNWTSGAPQGSGTSNSDLSAYSVTVGGVTATAYAFYATGTSTGPTSDLIGPTSSGAPQIGEYSGAGMAVCETQSGTNCNSPNHQISDGNNGSGSTYYYEFTLISFGGTAVNLGEIQLGNFGTNGTTGDPFGVTYYTSSSSSGLAAIESVLEGATVGGAAGFTNGGSTSCLTGQAALGGGSSGGGSYNDNCAVNGNGVVNLTGSNVTYLLIGAAVNGAGSDYFKIQDLNATVSSSTGTGATPEPATFGLLGIALGGLGLFARRRKSI